jgi:hypothetical protein
MVLFANGTEKELDVLLLLTYQPSEGCGHTQGAQAIP